MGHVSNEMIPPADLIDLQHAVDAAYAAWTAACRRQPLSSAVADGTARITDEMRAETRAAHAALADAAKAKLDHPWWGTLRPTDLRRADEIVSATARKQAEAS